MTQTSLIDVMNRMASAGFKAPMHDGETGRKPLDDVDAYRRHDALLEALYRDYLNAKAAHDALMLQYGIGDPMTQVACERMDSCQCAFDTRLIELRRDRALKQAVLARLKDMRADMEQCDIEKQKAERAYQKKLRDYHERDLHQIGRARKADRDSFANFMLLWQMLHHSAAYANHRLRIANAFMQASMASDARLRA